MEVKFIKKLRVKVQLNLKLISLRGSYKKTPFEFLSNRFLSSLLLLLLLYFFYFLLRAPLYYFYKEYTKEVGGIIREDLNYSIHIYQRNEFFFFIHFYLPILMHSKQNDH